MILKNRFQFLGLIALTLAGSACGNKNNLQITQVDVSTTQVSQVTYLNFQADVKIGNLKFPNIEVPILNPATMTSFGQLSLQRTILGVNKMIVSVDFQTATRLNPTLGYSLPNGREIPISLGAQNAALIGIPILENSRIYVGGDLTKDAYLGAAIVIPAFDGVLNQVAVPLNIFSSFPFSTSIMGVAGLFTSPAPGQNGLALFVKKSVSAPATNTALPFTMGKQSAPQSVAAVDGTLPSELNALDTRSLLRLHQLMNRRAVFRVK